MAYGATLGEHLVMAAPAKMFYIAMSYKNNGSRRSQGKISGDLTQTYFWITCRPYLWKWS